MLRSFTQRYSVKKLKGLRAERVPPYPLFLDEIYYAYFLLPFHLDTSRHCTAAEKAEVNFSPL